MKYAATPQNGGNSSITWNYLINSNYWTVNLV